MQKTVPVEYGHDGMRFLRDADMYPSLIRSTGEAVQNALDTGATKISITANIKSRHISVRDNGVGVNEEDFNTALRQVGVSTKKKGKLGRYGLGLISHLGKCRFFTFTSMRKGDRHGFLEWKFVTEDIRKMAKVQIPLRSRTDLTDDESKTGNGVTYVEWRAEVSLNGISDNALLNRFTLDYLAEHLIANYNKALQSSGAVVSVRFIDESGNEDSRDVTYRSFTGVSIQQHRHQHAKGGSATFDLFIARQQGGRRNGKVQVGEANDAFRFSFADFAKNHADWLDKETREIFTSGLLEGEVVDSEVSLHTNRQSFETDVALANFCKAINQWTKTIGSGLVEEVEQERTDERFQRIGLETLSKIDDLVRSRQDMALDLVLRSFKQGTIGRGHTPTPKDVIGQQEEKSLAVSGGESGSNNGESDGGGDGEPKEPKPDHSPMTVGGPRGTRRTIVRHHSVGLQLAYEMMPGSSELWQLDAKTGILRINKRHPYFVECLEKDVWLARLEEHIVVNALRVQAAPEDWREQIKMFLEDHTGDVVFLIKHGSAKVTASSVSKAKKK